jgi:hypothetical protein
MTIINKLASSLGRRDEVPNIMLAQTIAAAKDTAAVTELVECLSQKNKDIQNDSIKVLYEAAAIDPGLLKEHAGMMALLLSSKNNRLQWGAMTVLNAITEKYPRLVYSFLPEIIRAAGTGSVITNDQFTGILVKLCATKEYGNEAFHLLNEQLLRSPLNQLPMYAEMAVPVITGKHKATFINSLTVRLTEFEKESKKKRVEKVIKRCSTS